MTLKKLTPETPPMNKFANFTDFELAIIYTSLDNEGSDACFTLKILQKVENELHLELDLEIAKRVNLEKELIQAREHNKGYSLSPQYLEIWRKIEKLWDIKAGYIMINANGVRQNY